MNKIDHHNRFFVKPEEIGEKSFRISAAELKHIKVKRLNRGERLIGLEGRGGEYLGEVVSFDGRELECKILQIERHPPPQTKIILGISIIKTPNLALACEKAAELGVWEIYLVNSERSQREPSLTELERLNRVTLSALKQSGRFYRAKVSEPVSLSTLIDRFRERYTIVIADPEGDSAFSVKYREDVLALVGPEGGFSENELNMMEEAGGRKISLGTYRLRSETAAIMTAGMISLLIDLDWT